jgi:sugar/nucleoside kinase (ribokinase family)
VLGVEGSPEEQAQRLAARYPEASVVLTDGAAGAWAWDGELHHRPIVAGTEIDRIGRGDAFCAGFIFGRLERDTAYGLACGTALAALAQTYHGDAVWSTREEMTALLAAEKSAYFR